MMDQLNIAITILSALLTGGFILFFIENQHIERDVAEKFRSIMDPYYHKLSGYLTFVYFINGRIRYKDKNSEYIPELKAIVDELAKTGSKVYVSGRNISPMKASILNDLNNKIYNIWHFYDKGWIVTEKIELDSDYTPIFNDTLISETLSVISVKYSRCKVELSLLPAVSGEFYTEIWQRVSNVPHRYEYWQKKCIFNKRILLLSLFLVMVTFNVAMFVSDHISSYYITILTSICCLVFAYVLIQLNRLMKLSHRIFD